MTWIVIGGAFIVGTAFKTGYFYYARQLMIEDLKDIHLDATKNLREAQAFSSWSQENRQSRVPPLTDQQKQELQEYLALVAEHQFGEKPDEVQVAPRRG
eukprot:CAMPEP_0194046638 /NCGR_PEP_ID=MMETSP0009_2-20130614/22048_1 /TAXON_ID=210454 /ORGANISM="Grammatophora oceanica, Strain CCMP 410" /LENGTH=98 /DNA_ID=CAMNT_0038692009 /DNA_START=137 /DNA_END=433 /DNA_ORIENTATION=-